MGRPAPAEPQQLKLSEADSQYVDRRIFHHITKAEPPLDPKRCHLTVVTRGSVRQCTRRPRYKYGNAEVCRQHALKLVLEIKRRRAWAARTGRPL